MYVLPCSHVLAHHSFPTRRSSDLNTDTHWPREWQNKCPNRWAWSRHKPMINSAASAPGSARPRAGRSPGSTDQMRSEEHTSELRHVAISYAVFCLKKKKQKASKVN